MKLIGFWTRKFISIQELISVKKRYASHLDRQIYKKYAEIEKLKNKQRRNHELINNSEVDLSVALYRAKKEESHHHVSIFVDIYK